MFGSGQQETLARFTPQRVFYVSATFGAVLTYDLYVYKYVTEILTFILIALIFVLSPRFLLSYCETLTPAANQRKISVILRNVKDFPKKTKV